MIMQNEAPRNIVGGGFGFVPRFMKNFAIVPVLLPKYASNTFWGKRGAKP
jgi:hypothetical protein